eukprot:EST49429.1 Hypothetical protein SS50377_10259 [Spironucleus salmonicida]
MSLEGFDVLVSGRHQWSGSSLVQLAVAFRVLVLRGSHLHACEAHQLLCALDLAAAGLDLAGHARVLEEDLVHNGARLLPLGETAIELPTAWKHGGQLYAVGQRALPVSDLAPAKVAQLERLQLQACSGGQLHVCHGVEAACSLGLRLRWRGAPVTVCGTGGVWKARELLHHAGRLRGEGGRLLGTERGTGRVAEDVHCGAERGMQSQVQFSLPLALACASCATVLPYNAKLRARKRVVPGGLCFAVRCPSCRGTLEVRQEAGVFRAGDGAEIPPSKLQPVQSRAEPPTSESDLDFAAAIRQQRSE